MGLLVHVEPFRQFSLLLAMFPFVDGRDIALLLHDLSTAGVDLGSEGHALHGQPQFSLYALLDAALLLLLPLCDGLQEFGPQGVFFAGLLARGLLGDGLVGLVLLHPVHPAGAVITRGEGMYPLLLFHFGFEAQLHGLLALLDCCILEIRRSFNHTLHLTLSSWLVTLAAFLETLALETTSGVVFFDEGQCDFQFHAQLRVVLRGMDWGDMCKSVLIVLCLLGEVVVVVGLAPIHIELPRTLHSHYHMLTLAQMLLQDEGLGLDFGRGRSWDIVWDEDEV